MLCPTGGVTCLSISEWWYYCTPGAAPTQKLNLAHINRYFFLSPTSSSKSMDVRVQADPNPMPAPRPANTLRAPEAPPRESTTPARPPRTNPAAVWTTIFSTPLRMVDATARSEVTATGLLAAGAADDDDVASDDDDDIIAAAVLARSCVLVRFDLLIDCFQSTNDQGSESTVKYQW